jgi:hypothetical protein|tara:strand:- start:812 stop:1012 length:201 start_codon:yes stop_codon:yes gene_type:complete
MNGRTAKQLRQMVDPQTPQMRNVYRRLKKFYTSKVPHQHRHEFLSAASEAFENYDVEGVKKLMEDE